MQAIKSILKKDTGNVEDELAKNIYNDFIVYLAKAYDSIEILPQKNAAELFEVLKQKHILVILNTGYNRETAESLVKKLGWKKGKDFDSLITATDVKNNRPDPDMIILAMEQLGITNGKEVVKVGDSIIDIEEGKNAHCGLSIGITTGAHTYAQLETADPDYIISNLLELLPILEK